MFQYAAARRLAKMHKTELKLDISSFHINNLRKYELDCFELEASIATERDIDRCLGSFRMKRLRFLRKLGINLNLESIKSPNLLKELHYHFNPNVLTASNNSYLLGYWQSEKYFVDIKDTLLKEFTFRHCKGNKNALIQEAIRSTESVSIHIRRTDYITNPAAHQFHGVCSLEYYQNCIKVLEKKIENPHFFVFSDDPVWVQENFKINFPTTIVRDNDLTKGFEDLRLMIQCRHNIIANSSFSWWGAWLNSNPQKVVLAPRKWFRDSSVSTHDLLPKEWLII